MDDHSRVRRGRFAAAASAIVLLAAAFSPSALASWTKILSSPSQTAPFFVCPPRAGHAHCDLIRDPTRGRRSRGPVAAGAITAGPEAQASPALSGHGVEGGYSPADLRSAYNLPSTSGGSGQTVALVDALDDPNAEADLGVYRTEYGLGKCTTANGCFRKVDQTGGTNYPTGGSTGERRKWIEEISLDLDMASAVCPNCHILLVEASTSEGSDLSAAEQEAAVLGATEISNSFSEEKTDAHAPAYDHPGIPITAAGGDEGFGVEPPASYADVIAVGGTSLHQAEGRRGWSETVWSETGGGTGSGCTKEPKPSWQKDSGCAFRTTNDVSAVADPNTPVSVYDSTSPSPWLLVGGTSASAPIVAAAMALATPYTRSFPAAEGL
jgi:subtilase family serine protease